MAAPEESLRKRKAGKAGKAGGGPGSPPGPGLDPTGCSAGLRAGTFWLTRIVLLRALAFIYFVAFLVAFHQNKQLIGDRGLLPCRAYLKSIQQYFQGRVGWDAVSYAPTVLWLLDWSHMDSNLDALALLGLGVSSFVLVTGCANMVLMATLWVLYMSLVNVGQIWYSFGWESQLLETGFLGIFLCPLWTLSRLPRGTPPSRIVLWGFRWLIFRIMLGAGLIKIRGDRCWRDLTCMDFHYETQPVPNPAAYFLHQSPWWVHRGETLGNHFVELVVPFFIFLGRRMCVLHGALQILFQVILIISGNLSFLNWLTMVPSVACFDDATLGFLFPSGPSGLKYRVLKMQEEAARGAPAPLRYGCVVRQAVHLALAVLVAWLSVPVVLNLLSPTQIMNTSFNPLRIVNTYGAFGSITKERTEVILQGTAAPNASSPDAVWEDYEFKCKPGDPGRRPCLISPYHYRLDWLMWFAAFQVGPPLPRPSRCAPETAVPSAGTPAAQLVGMRSQPPVPSPGLADLGEEGGASVRALARDLHLWHRTPERQAGRSTRDGTHPLGRVSLLGVSLCVLYLCVWTAVGPQVGPPHCRTPSQQGLQLPEPFQQ